MLSIIVKTYIEFDVFNHKLHLVIMVLIQRGYLKYQGDKVEHQNLLKPSKIQDLYTAITSPQTELPLTAIIFVTRRCLSALQIFQQSCSQSFADKFTKLAIINHKIISILRRRK